MGSWYRRWIRDSGCFDILIVDIITHLGIGSFPKAVNATGEKVVGE